MRKVAIVGGGLGGLAAALALTRNEQVRVTIFEASKRLGGKAGASKVGSHFEDHGYHIFPPWYENIYGIVDDLGIRGHLKDVTRFYQLTQGAYPNFRALTNFTSFRFAWRNLWSGSVPFWDLALYYYSVIDLICQPYSRRAFLDQISVNGFVRSRFYRTEAVSKQYQDLLLKFISVPSYRVSAMTVRKMLSYWVANGVPMHRMLTGDMHTTFIEPWEKRLRQLGCGIVTRTRLTKLRVVDGLVVGLEFKSDDAQPNWIEDFDDVILAIPPRDLAPLIRDELYETDRDLSNVNYLNDEAMASLSLYLDRKITELPAEHINLLGSRFALTLIDVSQHWRGFDQTVLNVIASDVTELEGVSESYAEGQIIGELKRFLPFLDEAMITQSHFQSHFEEPLVMNEVGAWHFRPKTQTHIPNLYLAGAHCRHDVDVTSMEGAVMTGLSAANALMERHHLEPLWEIREPQPVRIWLFQLLRIAALPLAALGKAWVSMRQSLTEGA